MRARLSATAATGLLTAVLITLNGCAQDAPESQTPSSTASTSAPASPDSTGSTGSTGSPTPPSSPATTAPAATYTLAPATGPTANLDQMTLHLPRGWATPQSSGRVASSSSTDFLETLQSTSGRLPGSTSLEEGPASINDFAGYERDLPTQEPVVIAGQQWWHVAGMADSSTYVEAFGTTAPSGNDVTLVFEFLDRTPRQRRTETLGSVLASVILT